MHSQHDGHRAWNKSPVSTRFPQSGFQSLRFKEILISRLSSFSTEIELSTCVALVGCNNYWIMPTVYKKHSLRHEKNQRLTLRQLPMTRQDIYKQLFSFLPVWTQPMVFPSKRRYVLTLDPYIVVGC